MDIADNSCISGYLNTALHPKTSKIIINTIVKILKKIGLDNFDAIAFRGMSGALIVPSVCSLVRKPPIMCRKKDETCHSTNPVEGWIQGHRIVIVDDVISSGNTVKIIKKNISIVRQDRKSMCDSSVDPEYVAIILYNSSSFIPTEYSNHVPIYPFYVKRKEDQPNMDKKYNDPTYSEKLSYQIVYADKTMSLLNKKEIADISI